MPPETTLSNKFSNNKYYLTQGDKNYHDFSLGCHEYNLSDVIWAGNAARLRVVEIMTPSNRTAQVGFRKAFHLPEVSWISSVMTVLIFSRGLIKKISKKNENSKMI